MADEPIREVHKMTEVEVADGVRLLAAGLFTGRANAASHQRVGGCIVQSLAQGHL